MVRIARPVHPGQVHQVPPPQGTDFLSAYYGLISLADSCVGRIVAVLEETGRLEGTLISRALKNPTPCFDKLSMSGSPP